MSSFSNFLNSKLYEKFTDYRLPITDYRLPITDYRLPITDYRLPITGLILAIFFAFTACTADKDLTILAAEQKEKPIAELKKQMYENAQASWEEYVKKTGYKPPIGDGLLAGCNCAYEILDVQITPHPQYPDFGIDFISPNDCPGSSSDDCIYFSGYYYTACFSGGNNPNCTDGWANLPPIKKFPFNCDPPEYSSFGALLNSGYYQPDCANGGALESTLTFRVACVETCENYSYIAYSPPATLHYYDADPDPFMENWNSGSESTIIELHGCGCTPTLTE